MLTRLPVFFAALLILTGCYLPLDFEADINMDAQGNYAVRYKGDIIAVTLLSKISKGKVEGDKEIRKQAAIYQRDLKRDKGFKSVEHKKFARFTTVYERKGNIRQEKSFDFVRSNSRFFAIQRRKDGLIELLGDKPPKKHVDGLIARGIDTRGVLRVWTKAKVVHHNAHQVRQGSPAVYQWNIQSMRDPLPSLILQLR
jgi:hypothetical protein